MNRIVPALMLAATVAAAGCSSTPADSAAPVSAAADSGSQSVTGNAPPALGNFPSMVILEPIGGGTPSLQSTSPMMDQAQQTFIPSILLVRTGQPVDFFNHDDVLHNVRVKDDETKESAFNVAIPTGEKFTHSFARDGFYDVGCDIHPGMSAQILSTTSPWTVVAEPSGAFTIANVPNGPYKAIAYTGAQKVEKEVNIGPGAA
ncbi:MAG: plastocyanin/azurin family copper-binding protein, partial [Vicinamibacterales bacterium]